MDRSHGRITSAFFPVLLEAESCEVEDKVWGLDSESDINVVWTHIGFLRRKLRKLQADIEIKTIRGAGYILVEK